MSSVGSKSSSTSNSKRFAVVKRTTDAMKMDTRDLAKDIEELKKRMEKVEIDLNTFKFDIGYRQGMHYAKNKRPEVRKKAYSTCTAAYEGDKNYAELCAVAHAGGKFPRPGGTVNRLVDEHRKFKAGEKGATRKLERGRSEMAERAKKFIQKTKNMPSPSPTMRPPVAKRTAVVMTRKRKSTSDAAALSSGPPPKTSRSHPSKGSGSAPPYSGVHGSGRRGARSSTMSDGRYPRR